MGNIDKAKSLWQDALEKESKYADVEKFAEDYTPAEDFMNAVREVAALGLTSI